MAGTTRRAASLLLAILMGLGAPGVLGGPADAATTSREQVRRPVAKHRSFADPSVTRFRGRYVGVATGGLAPRSEAASPAGPWRKSGKALTRRPAWATGNGIWASDLVKVGPRWVLYYSIEVAGLGEHGRCIGVATAHKPTGSFRPYGDRPLVCPRQARAARAGDTLARRPAGLPRRGVIDAAGFRSGKRQFLVYRTQGTPATIRLVRLSRNGLRARRAARSRELVRTEKISENPVLIARGRSFYLLTSEGSYTGCGYRTTWRRTTKLWDWSRSRPRVLLSRGSTRLCGPGGLDVVDSAARRRPSAEGGAQRALIFLHAWTCPKRAGVCPAGHDYSRETRWRPRRSLYAAWLWWQRGRPRVTSFLRPTRRRPMPLAPTAPSAPAMPTVPVARTVPIGPQVPLPALSAEPGVQLAP